jgi:hypothetical protein
VVPFRLKKKLPAFFSDENKGSSSAPTISIFFLHFIRQKKEDLDGAFSYFDVE